MRTEFFPVTAEEAVAGPLRRVRRDARIPRRRRAVWEELLITPKEVERQGDRMLVRGRVYLRSRELGIRDMSAAWIWDRAGALRPRRVFADPEQAVRVFSREGGSEPHPDPGGSRSTTRLR